MLADCDNTYFLLSVLDQKISAGILVILSEARVRYTRALKGGKCILDALSTKVKDVVVCKAAAVYADLLHNRSGNGRAFEGRSKLFYRPLTFGNGGFKIDKIYFVSFKE